MRARALVILGTRPQFIKYFPLAGALDELRFDQFVVNTGQHWDYEMSSLFIDQLGLSKPNLTLSSGGSSQAIMLARILDQLDQLISASDFDFVIVFGDTNSTLGGALWASVHGLPVVHIESGLRSFEKSMPEERNRILTDHLTSIHFCPTRNSVANLAREGITDSVFHVGDVMLDAVIRLRSNGRLGRSSILEDLRKVGPFSVVTIHRAENTSSRDQLQKVVDFATSHSRGVPIIPVHPRTKAAFEQFEINRGGLLEIPPVGYIEMLDLIAASEMVFTDSGGLQKEAYFLRKECVTLRSSTEWPETVDSGWNHLWTEKGKSKKTRIDDFGAGNACLKIGEILSRVFF